MYDQLHSFSLRRFCTLSINNNNSFCHRLQNMILFVFFNWLITADWKCLKLPLPLKKFCILYHWQLSIFFNGIHCCPAVQCVTHVVSSFAIVLERKKVIKIFLNIEKYTVQPKIMHAQEVLASQEHATRPRSKNVVCFFWNAGSWKSNRKKPQEAARTYESYCKSQDGARSCYRSNCLFVYFVYKCHVGGRNAQRLLAMLSIR